MKQWKKVTALFCLALSLVFVSACGGKAATGNSEKPAAAPAAAKAPARAKKTLVVYYTNTHRTEQAAKVIAKETGGDLLLMELEKPYTEADLDYNNKESRVSKEHNDPKLRDPALKNGKPANWKEYDTVFVGYPIWWGIAAWPLDTFVKSNDFSGKTVIPFATAYSSGMGDSAGLLKEMAGNKGTWLEGRCFTGTLSDSKIAEWVSTLGVK